MVGGGGRRERRSVAPKIRWLDKLTIKQGQKNTLLGRVQIPEWLFQRHPGTPNAPGLLFGVWMSPTSIFCSHDAPAPSPPVPPPPARQIPPTRQSDGHELFSVVKQLAHNQLMSFSPICTFCYGSENNFPAVFEGRETKEKGGRKNKNNRKIGELLSRLVFER